MSTTGKRDARNLASRAQQKFERAQGSLERETIARRESFQRAAEAGLSMAEIAEAAGLHRSRVNQIIKGK